MAVYSSGKRGNSKKGPLAPTQPEIRIPQPMAEQPFTGGKEPSARPPRKRSTKGRMPGVVSASKVREWAGQLVSADTYLRKEALKALKIYVKDVDRARSVLSALPPDRKDRPELAAARDICIDFIRKEMKK